MSTSVSMPPASPSPAPHGTGTGTGEHFVVHQADGCRREGGGGAASEHRKSMSESTASGSTLAAAGDERPTVGDKLQSIAETLEEGLVGMRRNARVHERATDIITRMLTVVNLVVFVLILFAAARETSQTAVALVTMEYGINLTTYGFINLWEQHGPETSSLLVHQYEALLTRVKALMLKLEHYPVSADGPGQGEGDKGRYA